MRAPSLRVTAVFFLAAALCLSALAQAMGKKGIDLASLDKTCEPCEDFYKFANGGWLASKENQVPAAYPYWNKATILGEKNLSLLRDILEAAGRDTRARKGSNEQLIGDLFVNGKLTLGENIAEQRFFIAYAQSYATNMRPEFERYVTGSDPHSLGRFRVNGPLSNMPQFAAAFGCKAGDPMVRPEKDRCQVW